MMMMMMMMMIHCCQVPCPVLGVDMSKEKEEVVKRWEEVLIREAREGVLQRFESTPGLEDFR